MRKLAIVSGIVVGILVLAVLAVWLLVDVNQYRGTIQAQLETQLGRKVTLGTMNLRLLPFRFQVADPVIGEDPSFGETPFVGANSVDVQVSLLSLLRGNVQIHSIELVRPSVELIKDKDGRWNFSTIAASSSSTPQEAPGEAAPPRTISLDRLTIRDGQVALTDIQEGQPRTVYDHIDLTLLDYSPGQPFSLDLAVHIPGEGAQELHLKGEGGPLADPNPLATPFKGTLSLNQIGIDGLQKFMNAEMLANAAGSLSGETQITNAADGAIAAGMLKLDGARFNGVDIGYPITLDYDVKAELSQGQFAINKATMQLGQTPLSLTGTISTASTPPNLDLQVRSGDVSITEIARLASAFGVAFAPGTDVAGRVSADIQAKGSAASPALNGTIAGRDLSISGKDMPLPVSVKAVDLALSPTEIRSNEFNATSGQTNVAAQFAVRQYTSTSPSVDVRMKAPNATLPEIQSIAKAYGVTGLEQLQGAGGLNLDLRAAGQLQSLTSTSVMRSLNGAINLDFSPLRIDGFDALSQLGKIGGFAGLSENKGFTEILRMTGAIVVRNGVAQTDNLQVRMAAGNLTAAGTADLATEALNMKLTAVFSKESSAKVGGTGVGGYLTTALANGAGELVIPALLTGTFKQPVFSPDSKTFVQMQTRRLVPSLDNPGAAVSNILGAFQKKEDPNQAQPAEEKKNPVRGILDGFLGGRK